MTMLNSQVLWTYKMGWGAAQLVYLLVLTSAIIVEVLSGNHAGSQQLMDYC